jgi:hypothetical protein
MATNAIIELSICISLICSEFEMMDCFLQIHTSTSAFIQTKAIIELNFGISKSHAVH